jgi:hypothetical protein
MSGQIKITPNTADAKIAGTDSATIVNGVAKFYETIFEYKPGASDVKYIATAKVIDQDKVSHLNLGYDKFITVNFRFCKPGEIINNGHYLN